MKKIILGLSLVASSYLSAQTASLPQGWTNLGVVNEASISDIQSSSIDYIWRYNQGIWEIYSPDSSILNSLQNDVASGNMSYSIITTPLRIGDALWIHATDATTIHLGQSSLRATVTGTVKDAISNDLITNANISVYTQSGTLISAMNTSTDDNGTFEFTNVQGGDYIVSFCADGYNDLNISTTVASQEFNIGQVRMIPVDGASSIAVNGEIINAVDGSAISGARVVIIPGFNNNDISSATYDLVTDENGTYSVPDIAPGQYTLLVKHTGYYNQVTNVTVVSTDDSTSMTLNQSLTPQLADNEALRAKVEWGEYPSDLDSHLVSYNVDTQSINWHIYFGNETPADANGTLDRDDTDSYGPETITLNSVDNNNTYKYYIHKYAGTGDLKNSNAKVSIVYNGRLYQSEVPYEDGTVWKVFDITNGVLNMCETGCMSNINAGFDYSDISTMRTNISEQNSLRKIAEDIKSSAK